MKKWLSLRLEEDLLNRVYNLKPVQPYDKTKRITKLLEIALTYLERKGVTQKETIPQVQQLPTFKPQPFTQLLGTTEEKEESAEEEREDQ